MIRKIRLTLILLLIKVFIPGILLAQVAITGIVTDSKDQTTLPGVTVLEKNTSIGAITGIDGKYNITVPKDAILIFSFVGYASQEVIVGNQTVINIVLESQIELLDEVIVIGYGTQKKSDKTGAVFNVSSEEIQTVAIQDPIESIQGKVAGVSIRKSGSDPNSGFNVNIRGASGLSSSTDPLYVIDGVVGVNPTTIAPEDIESFNILKDASSAAIYGSRGANGVIIITTKTGKKDQTIIEINSYLTVDQVSSRSRLDLMTADEYRAYADELGITIRDEGFNTDWQNEIYRTGISHNESVAISGGNINSSYRGSISNNIQEGVIKNSGKERTIMRLNAQTKGLNDKLTLSMNLANTIEHNDYINYGSPGADGTIFQAFQRNPTLPVYNEDGSYYQDPTPPVNNYSNPVAILNDIQNERDAKRLLANIKADLEIINGLIFSINGAYTRDDDEKWYFEPASNGPLNGEGKAERSYNNSYSYLAEGFLNYTKEFGNHNLNLLGGYSFQEFGWDGFGAYGENPSSDYTQSDNLGSLSEVEPGDIKSWKGSSRLISGFGRMVYNYKNKYFLTATLRRDGSSRFGTNNEWGLFPSASVKWNIARESFMKDLPYISQAQLRVGYGQTGNQEIGTYKDLSLFGITGYVKDPITGEYTVTYGAIQNANPDLKWEVNTELNFGFDFGLFDNRLNGSLDVYNKKTTDLIYVYSVPVPPNLYPTTLANAGQIDINGIEVVLSGFIIDRTKIKWKSTVVVTHDEAIVTSLGNEDFPPVEKVYEGWLQEPLGYGTSTQIMMEGYQRGTWYGPKFAGIDKNTGEFLYEKADGTYNTIDNIDDEDKQILGTSQPTLEIGFNNYIKLFENWDISFTFRGMFGHEILNATNMVFDNPSYFPTRNVLNTAPDRTELQGSSDFSDYFLEKGNFVRLENITIGYNFKLKRNKIIKTAHAYIAGNNLFTITNYSGIDPSTIGIDIFNVYPKSTSVTLGLNLTF